jgi:hypothetical protein
LAILLQFRAYFYQLQETWSLLERTSKSALNLAFWVPDQNFPVIDGPKVAFVISVTECMNHTSVLDGAAVLRESILETQQEPYELVALIYSHGNITKTCTEWLRRLGYQVQFKDLPFQISELKSGQAIAGGKGCCGIAEYIKLYAFNMTEYDVIIHLDVDVIVFQSLRDVIEVLFRQDSTAFSLLPTIPAIHSLPSNADFVFVREYKTYNRGDPTNPKKYGIQGAFFAVRPNRERFQDMIVKLKTATFITGNAGWGGQSFGGYWGAAQIQGFLSYYYFHFASTGIELDHCRYNTLGHDLRYLPDTNGTCRTGQDVCEDCSLVPLGQVIVGHLSRCLKPWWCRAIIYKPETPLCGDMVRYWFDLRGKVDDRLGIKRPATNHPSLFHEVAHGYCQARAFYVPLDLSLSTTQ